jgi:hypothetical protein
MAPSDKRAIVKALLFAAAIAQLAVPAGAVACSGACGPTIFNPTTAVACQSVSITLTGSNAGTIYGGDIYRYDSDLQAAAVHQGLLANGATGTLYAFWAGTRYAFSPVTRNGITSSSSATDNYGIILSATATCPTFTATANPVTNIVATWTAATGSGMYTFSTSVNAAVLHYGLAAVGQSISLIYTHNSVVAHQPFYTSRTASYTSTALAAATEGYALRSDSTSFTYSANATRVYYDGTPDYTCQGWSYYHYASSLNAAIAHSGEVSVVASAYVYVHYVTNRWLFLQAKQNGITCTGATLASPEPAFHVSLASTVTAPLHDDITSGVINNDGRVTSTSVVGTTYYTYDSDLTDVLFHADVIPLNTRAQVYVHYIGTKSLFYGSDFRGLTSQSSANASYAVYVSTSATTPTAADLAKIRVRFSKPRTCSGTGYYRASSDLATAAFHLGLIMPGETKDLYLHELGVKTEFYLSSYRGISCSSHFGSDNAFTLATTFATPTQYNAFPIPITLTATRACSTLSGVGIYSQDSDLTCVAQHLGLLPLEHTATLWLHQLGNQQIFHAATMFECASTFSTNAQGSVTLTRGLYTPTAYSTLSAYPVNITADSQDGVLPTFGVGVFFEQSCVKKAALLEGLMKVGETKVIWIHPQSSAIPEYFAACRAGAFCSTPMPTNGTYPFSLSLTSTSSQSGLPATTVKVNLVHHNNIENVGIVGFRETGYRNLGSITRMAFQSELLLPDAAPDYALRPFRRQVFHLLLRVQSQHPQRVLH